jgi:hypothetical protein
LVLDGEVEMGAVTERSGRKRTEPPARRPLRVGQPESIAALRPSQRRAAERRDALSRHRSIADGLAGLHGDDASAREAPRPVGAAPAIFLAQPGWRRRLTAALGAGLGVGVSHRFRSVRRAAAGGARRSRANPNARS